MLKQIIVGTVFSVACAATIIAGAQQTGSVGEPILNIDPSRHGNLARAQELSRQAYDAITRAQQANEYELNGHAAKAKEYLRQANDELKQAAITSNQRR